MKKTKKNISGFFKRGLALMIAFAMLFSTNITSVFAADPANTSGAGKYIVPVEGVTSAAPIAAVNVALNTVFGEAIEVEVHEDGTKTAIFTPQHMEVDLMGKYQCNILKLKVGDVEGEILGTHTALLSPNFGAPEVTEEITVPTKIKINLPEPNAEGNYIVGASIDFMNSFMNGGATNHRFSDLTITLNFGKATADTSELNAALENCADLRKEDYTEESWNALQSVVAEAKELLANNPSYAAVSDMTRKVLDAKANLQALEDVDGNYVRVDKALKTVPEDLSKYTDESAAKVKAAVEAVVRGLKANEQARIDKMAEDIETAVKGLVEKKVEPEVKPEEPEVKPEVTPEETTEEPEAKPEAPEVLDKNNLKDGIYEVGVKLWKADKNEPSMAASSLKANAKIEVKNGVYTMYIYTRPMTMGSITASLQEMKVYANDGSYVNAQVCKKDAQGNPTCFSFRMPHHDKFIKVKVNPHVEMMGNQDLDARILVDYSKLEKISGGENGQSVDLTSSTQYGSIVKTGDNTQTMMYVVLTLMSVALIAVVLYDRKRRTV